MNFQNQESEKVGVDGHTEHNSAPAVYRPFLRLVTTFGRMKIGSQILID